MSNRVVKLKDVEVRDVNALLRAVINRLGYSVIDKTEDEGSNGEVNYVDKRVTVWANFDEEEQLNTLAHELGHILMHADFGAPRVWSSVLRDLEAEKFAYTVMKLLGFDTSELRTAINKVITQGRLSLLDWLEFEDSKERVRSAVKIAWDFLVAENDCCI